MLGVLQILRPFPIARYRPFKVFMIKSDESTNDLFDELSVDQTSLRSIDLSVKSGDDLEKQELGKFLQRDISLLNARVAPSWPTWPSGPSWPSGPFTEPCIFLRFGL